MPIENRKLVPSLPASGGRVEGSQSAEANPPEADSSRRNAEPQPDRLMARFQGRLDADAFEQIVSSYMSPALAVARQILSDHALAEDAVQESFLRVIRKRQQYIPGSPFSCWFYAIVRNVCVDMLRKRARYKEVIRNSQNENPLGDCRFSIADCRLKIANRKSQIANDKSEIPKLLDVLTSGERDVLVLRIVHGLGFRDVAAALGISEEAAKKRAQRALRRLRASLLSCESKKGGDSQSPPDKSCLSADKLSVAL